MQTRKASGTLAALTGLFLLLALGPASGGAADAAGPGPVLQREFSVYLEDRRIGTHRFEVVASQDGDDLRVSSVAEFDVKILGLRAYRYRHHAQERWREGCLAELSAQTDDNGHELRVTAQAGDKGLQVQGSGPPRTVQGCLMSYAYWNPRLLSQQQLLNPQTGDIDCVRVEPVGNETLELGPRRIPARHYRLSSKTLQIDLWYSLQGEWLQLDSTTKDGKRLRYRLNS